jgi:hypothetical protein
MKKPLHLSLAAAVLWALFGPAARGEDFDYYEQEEKAPPKVEPERQVVQERLHPEWTNGGSYGTNCCCCCCDGPQWGGEIFFGANAIKSPVDDNRNNNFGLLTSVNAGMLIWDNVGVQIGGSYGGYDFHGRSDAERDTQVEQQWFLTAGVFKHSMPACGDRWSWGVVYDYFDAKAFGEDGRPDGPDLHQFRGMIGYALDCCGCNEVGVWFNVGVEDGHIIDSDNPQANIRILDQFNVYWRRHWCCGGETMFYVGIPDGEPGEVVLGFNGVVPLDCDWALMGGWHYVVPSTRGGNFPVGSPVGPLHRDELWNIYFGITFSPGAFPCCNTLQGARWRPLLPVANAGYMPMTVDPTEQF